MRRSARKHPHDEQQTYRHSAYDLLSEKRSDQQSEKKNDRSFQGLDVSHEALQSLLNSRFQFIDLVDLLKKLYPKLFTNDQKRELQFLQQLSQTNTGKSNESLKIISHWIDSDGRVTLKDFERQSSILLGERINLLTPFYSSPTRSSTTNDQQVIAELRQELALCRSTIDQLQNQILTCEKSQRLAEQVELEYEDLMKFVYKHLRQYKQNEINQSKYLRANDQLIRKLFNYFSHNLKKSTDEQILSQWKFEYEQQMNYFSGISHENGQNHSNLSKKFSHQQV